MKCVVHFKGNCHLGLIYPRAQATFSKALEWSYVVRHLNLCSRTNFGHKKLTWWSDLPTWLVHKPGRPAYWLWRLCPQPNRPYDQLLTWNTRLNFLLDGQLARSRAPPTRSRTRGTLELTWPLTPLKILFWSFLSDSNP